VENQNTEWKESWRDEYLKWICAFANAQGGILEIGKDDEGCVVGVANAKKLLVDLPNKIRQATGIIADVGLLQANGREYIRIAVEPYPYPISCRGKYYYRSGSTTQELSGYSLDSFMLQKQGKTWDGVPVPHARAADLDYEAFQEFRRKALASERLTKADLDVTDAELLDSLLLTEGDYLNRAAILLFHRNPEKWVFGAYVKIGFFENDANLIYQDEIHGPLILMPDKTLDTIYLKYFKGLIRYEGIQRVDSYPVPKEALREALLNAIVHRDYSTGVPIQIKVYTDQVLIYNDGRLPEHWTVEDLLSKHRSKPYNPLIANTFFRSGMIEAWGRGIEKITEACTNAGKPLPAFKATPAEITVSFSTGLEKGHTGINSEINSEINLIEQQILGILRGKPEISLPDIAEVLGVTRNIVEYRLTRLKKLKRIERIGARKNGKWLVR
jgi:ATP-dependent DNA helicase RecG